MSWSQQGYNQYKWLPGGTPVNSWWGCAARFYKSWPHFRPKYVIFHTRVQTGPLKSIPFFRPALWEIMLSLLRLEGQQRDFLKAILNSHITLSILFIWNWHEKYVHTLPWFPRKLKPDLDKNGQNLYPFSDRNDAKTIPFGAADTYIAYISPPPLPTPPPSYLYSLKPS